MAIKRLRQAPLDTASRPRFVETLLLARVLVGIKAKYPVANTAVAVPLITVALLATVIPGLRVTKVDSLNALHYE